MLSDFGCVRFGLISLRYQTVPSPFGSGVSVSEVVPCVLHSLLVRATRRRCTGRSGAGSSSQPEPTQLTKTTTVTYEVLVFSVVLSRQRTAIADYRLSCSDAQPASLVSLTLCVLPRTMTMMVPEMPYSRL